MRKCKVTVKVRVPIADIPNSYKDGFEEQDATFHQFGSNTYTGSEGMEFQYSVAIVEMADGKVVTVEPDKVRFTDSPQ